MTWMISPHTLIISSFSKIRKRKTLPRKEAQRLEKQSSRMTVAPLCFPFTGMRPTVDGMCVLRSWVAQLTKGIYSLNHLRSRFPQRQLGRKLSN